MKIDLHLRHLSSTPNLCSSEMLCNLLLWSCFSSLLMFGLGCEEEVPLPMQITDAAMPQKMEPDAAPFKNSRTHQIRSRESLESRWGTSRVRCPTFRRPILLGF